MTDLNSNKSTKSFSHMIPRKVEAFPYYVGIPSLEEVATREDRVCVLNILGGESRTVTPISHSYSGGNVVCGTMPGRSGSVLKTSVGNIPVYNNVLEALDAGHRFNVAVVYVPPSGVRDAVIEAVRVNRELKKIIILTEKVSVKSARTIRQYCQWSGVDVFGANCLGVADAHHKVRLGGALGGSHPDESLVPGSIALYSNSGNFTTTMAVYLLTAGWGTTVSVSSGKDVYIHFAAAEFTHAMHNDPRTKAAVMYIEPGGYYEQDLVFDKPVIACVLGRWKAKLSRACGHAGAIAGSGDNAFSKEQWFMDKFGVDSLYTPENPVYSKKGAVVTNIAHIPQAMTAVMKMNGTEPDFAPRGNLSLKCWFANSQGIQLPPELDIAEVEAVAPYNGQISGLKKQVGVVLPRQTLKDASGASRMDPKTQISEIHGLSVLEASTHSFEENLIFSLTRDYPDANGHALANVILNGFVNQSGSVLLAAADAAREAGNSPNTVLASAVAILGPKVVASSCKALQGFVDLFGLSDLSDPNNLAFDFSKQLEAVARDGMQDTFVVANACKKGEAMLAAIETRAATSVFVKFLQTLAKQANGHIPCSVMMAAISAHLGWQALVHKRLSVNTFMNIPWHLRIFSAVIGASVSADRQAQKDKFCDIEVAELMGSWSFTETAFLALLNRRPDKDELYSISVLLGLIITNGPGTISAQGAKGAVSADGPEVPDRVQVNKSYIGFLTHTGFAHGGNGYEAIAFLLDRFRKSGLRDPGDSSHGQDLKAMAMAYAKEYKTYKTNAKAAGNINYAKVPCVNHPVFKNKEVNFDPREVFVDELFKERKSYNIFQDFYHELVKSLYETGVSRNVYCVNVDAVIAVILLKMLWIPFQQGQISEQAIESAAFTTFLFGRMIGTAAEIDDHTNRGKNMDTRTAASKCSFAR